MDRHEAEPLAFKVIQTVQDCCERIEVAGSLRRRCGVVNDIDFVVIPRLFMWNRIAIVLHLEMDASVLAAGPELIRLSLPYSLGLIQLDFYAATPETWGVLLLIRTGSKDHNVKLCSHARNIGLMLSAARGVIKNGQVIASRTEEEIFKALALDYVAPSEREI